MNVLRPIEKSVHPELVEGQAFSLWFDKLTTNEKSIKKLDNP